MKLIDRLSDPIIHKYATMSVGKIKYLFIKMKLKKIQEIIKYVAMTMGESIIPYERWLRIKDHKILARELYMHDPLLPQLIVLLNNFLVSDFSGEYYKDIFSFVPQEDAGQRLKDVSEKYVLERSAQKQPQTIHYSIIDYNDLYSFFASNDPHDSHVYLNVETLAIGDKIYKLKNPFIPIGSEKYNSFINIFMKTDRGYDIIHALSETITSILATEFFFNPFNSLDAEDFIRKNLIKTEDTPQDQNKEEVQF